MNAARCDENASLYALDLLEGDERAAFEAELQRDPDLRHLVDELRETSALFAFTAPAASPSPFLRERVLASAAAARAPVPTVAPVRTWSAVAWAAAAGFALVAAYASWDARALRQELGAERAVSSEIQAEASARAERTAQEAVALRERLDQERALAGQIITELRRQADVAELKVASLASLLGQSPEAQAIAVWNPLTQEGVLTVVNLPGLETGKDYQLWLIDPQYDIPVDGGVFRVDPATGEARVTFRPGRPVAAVDKFAVSLERAGGVPKAEGPMVLISP
jgi:anti-sigma-K factor RskA